jgi:hypothetical protein
LIDLRCRQIEQYAWIRLTLIRSPRTRLKIEKDAASVSQGIPGMGKFPTNLSGTGIRFSVSV